MGDVWIFDPTGRLTSVATQFPDLPPVAADISRLGMASPLPSGHLPRLPPEYYRGHAFVFWTNTIANRATGWLNESFHRTFREVALHAAAREQLLCPIYTLMPDHLHLVWMGTAEDSDQRAASRFLREQLAPRLAPHDWQHQPHDHVLRDRERERGAFAATCAYIAANPVRAGLVPDTREWMFTGCVLPGYPNLHPLHENFWDLFWRIHHSAVEAGRIGTIKRENT